MAQQGAVWMLSGRDFRSDFPFFGTIGFIFSLIQWFGYRYFYKSNLGTDLLVEHIAFNSPLMTVMFLWFAKWGVERLCIIRDRPLLHALIAHVSTRAVAFAAVAAATVIGFGAAAAVCRNIGPALWTGISRCTSLRLPRSPRTLFLVRTTLGCIATRWSSQLSRPSPFHSCVEASRRRSVGRHL
ncbi:hypothetical protein [Burkholderia territorii]|uniref:hypothetical protein n=1 Tax=Burkholderia territorii TaxID=1503055 RepID=UPI0012D93B8F|nr:hypothetical protein [Burkholderia territorii]